MYRVNSQKIRELINGLGDFGLAKTSQGARVSVSLLEKMYAGTYMSSPRETVRERLATFFNVSEAELFISAGTKKRRAS